MIQERNFNHPCDLSNYELSPSIMGSFQHEYKLKTIKSDNVVIDHSTGLMWQQSGSSHRMAWEETQNYIIQLNRNLYAGSSNWRLPTIEELASLIKSTKTENIYI